MALIVTLKNNPTADIADMFRQVELWSQFSWTPMVLMSGWANVAGHQIASYCIDPLGFVHFRGTVTYTGMPANLQQITALSAAYSPPAREDFVLWSNQASIENSRIGVFSNGDVALLLDSASVNNPSYSLSGILYTTF